MSAGPRYTSLDGLRGVAAVTVMVYHALLVVPAVAAIFVFGHEPNSLSLEWWLYHTPIRLAFAGPEAVLVFFMLSGFVLTLPLLKGGSLHHWRAYFGRRLLRLYLPVWGAIVFAYLIALIVPRDPEFGSAWLRMHLAPQLSVALRDGVLLHGTSNLDSPLWSLQWEVWFSLLLPLLFFGLWVLRASRWWFPAVILLAATSAVAHDASVKAALSSLPGAWMTWGLLTYLPVFGIGMILATKSERLATFAIWIGSRRHAHFVWFTLTGGALVLTICSTVFPVSLVKSVADSELFFGAELLGIVLLLFVSMHAPGMQRLFQSAPIQWAGSRSFSLYLIHEPILVATALATRSHDYLPWLFIAMALVPVILVAAEAFNRLIEHPAHLLAKTVGRRLASARPRETSSIPVGGATSDNIRAAHSLRGSTRPRPHPPSKAGPDTKIVIAIPTFRRPAQLDTLLRLLPQQCAQLGASITSSVDILVADNDPGSSASGVVLQHDAIYVSEPRPGLAYVRNRLLTESAKLDPDVIVFIDDDETPEEGWLVALIGLWRQCLPQAIAGRVESTFDGYLDPWIHAGGFFRRPEHETGDRVDIGATNNLLIDARFVTETHIRFDDRFGMSGGEDSKFTSDLVRAGGTILFCNEALVIDHVPRERMSRSWVLQRAFHTGTVESAVSISMERRESGLILKRAQLAAQGVARLAIGSARRFSGRLARSLSLEARGARTARRGAGLLVGAFGLVDQEYAKRANRSSEMTPRPRATSREALS